MPIDNNENKMNLSQSSWHSAATGAPMQEQTWQVPAVFPIRQT